MTYERRAMKALWNIAYEESRGKCPMPGPHEGPLELHHIAGRDNAVCWVPELCIMLCACDHRTAKTSAHEDPKGFIKWLAANYPEKHKVYLEIRYKRVHDRDMKMKQICKELEARADQAMYMVA